jgi:hypothetical protein
MTSDEVIFYTFLVSTLTGFILALTRMAYKSKCKEVNCGCIKIIRDTDVEEKEMEFTRTHPIAISESEKKQDLDI